MMTQLLTVRGLFNNAAEAQQAIQGLLAMGFSRETVELSTHTGSQTTIGDSTIAGGQADASSGRFFSSLFSSPDEVWSQRRPAGWVRFQLLQIRTKEPDNSDSTVVGLSSVSQPVHRCDSRGSLITVKTQTAAEAKQVADLLETAGAEDVIVDKGVNSGQESIRPSAA
ncbi:MULTISPECIES: hypothetical protein [Spirosoma]|uniref:SPOR domain-containing protein n=1 Tax=Spirosoma liriopis TaxID=2937440 RepID=A0ABT0HVS8_9BACT|nr:MULTISPECIES: hypothetical protein [Spirosoma]MCK8495605.1 hypothetical protein [Spirosoma liriopis]UHG94541.1 hypothetical protein LQ777_28550 [Spirosoma oryzicola]